MKLTVGQLKNRFATGDMPAAKDFDDFIDTLLANNVTDTHINALINAAITSLSSSTGAPLLAQASPPAYSATTAGTAIWLQTTDGAGNTVTRPYYIRNDASSGPAVYNWHSRHPIPSGTIMLVTDLTKLGIVGIDNTSAYVAFTTALATYDGGGSPGTGAMWEVVTELTGRFPLQIDPANYPFNTTGGEATHTLNTNEIPAHNHTDGTHTFLLRPPYPAAVAYDTPGNNNGAQSIGPGDGSAILAAGGGLPHNNLPPYRVGYFLRRTTRTDYVVPAAT